MRLSELKGIGQKTEQLFNNLNIYTTDDLLNFFPRKYDVFDRPVCVDEMTGNSTYAVWATVCSQCTQTQKGKLSILKFRIADEKGVQINITYFNMPFLKNSLKTGYKCIFRGEVAFRGNLILMEQPKMYSYEEYKALMNTLQPVYHLCAGLTNNQVKKTVKQVLSVYNEPEEFIPLEILEKEKLISHKEALNRLHFPDDYDSLKRARKRIVFEEFFLFSLAVRSIKDKAIYSNNRIIINKSPYSSAVLDNLGYQLTNAQNRVYDEIMHDMSGNHTMNRLIQGDVGSGKTIVAFLAMLDCCYSGFQSALMAPTEVLAKQHFDNLNEILQKNKLDINCTLLTGSMTAKAKKEAHEACKSGSADIIIGTHALITENVEFHNLGLVITDEQHRFGVRQREALHLKGTKDIIIPHIMVMSATPIPRSLALILYADMELSVIDEKPSMRLPVKNCIVDASYRPNAYSFIKKELDKGHQAYVICAMAKSSDDTDISIENVVDYCDKLRKIFSPDINIQYLHGKLSAKDKNRIMEAFAHGEIHILVSTTVVEVGVNVPNATVMLIENAERFGLAGLHQLRGRVGRKDEQSYCIFVSNSKNELTKKRLEILKNSNDGFYIAQQDLSLRGPGDILGSRQSGEFGFMLADIYIDADTLQAAGRYAGEIMKKITPPILTNKVKEYVNSRMKNLNL